ncbi:uncharacterized protein LOC121694912 [Alosa sapidissima]|uniref:uncharacterized protein LOC121694912 n=1 Tax=Alosa sapidissima TaxID=34773 RepID=UPI001C091E58|nr:uncharacterized protein LOC121694912 [Alosa sapidissima]
MTSTTVDEDLTSNIQPPIGASHEDLFVLLCDSQDIPPAADILPGLPTPQTSGRKQTQKRKHIEPAGTAHKRAGGQVRPGPSTPPANDPVIAALSNIQASLLDMTARISTLESDAIRPSSSPTVISASGVSTAPELRHLQHQPQRDDVTPEFIPRRSLATAVPLTTGSPFFPPSSAIPHHLRSQILAEIPSPVSRSSPVKPGMPPVQPNHFRLNDPLQSYVCVEEPLFVTQEPGLHLIYASSANSADCLQTVIQPIFCV